MKRPIRSDADVVEKARRRISGLRKFRWFMLAWAVVFLGLCSWATSRSLNIIGTKSESEQLSIGFVFGLTLAVAWTTFGILGALCLGKFLTGFNDDARTEELLVRYHDRLHELNALPDETKSPGEGPI